MTSIERVLTTLHHSEPDRVPIFDFIYSRPLYKEIIGRVPSYYNAEDVMTVSYRIGYDLAVIPFGGVGGFLNYDVHTNIYTDEWGTRFEKKEDTWPVDAPIDFPIKDRSDLKNYSWPDPNNKERLREVKTALKIAKEKKMAVFGSIRGPFSSTWLLMGIENFMIKLFDDPDFVDIVITKCTDFFIQGGLLMAESGVNALLFADDYGSNDGPLISPEHFNKHILPQVKRMVNTFQRIGIPFIMHSDGNLNLLIESLVNSGISGYHPIERSAKMDLFDIKKRYGKKITLLGNVNNKTTLVLGSKEDVEKEVLECIKIAAPGGGYILASDHSLHDDIPNANVFALYEAGRKYGTYPLVI